ncbi:fatty acid synthase alpha subunit Lsd1 [Coemansia sp. RSA 2424]|nr:fatty acid synthase alpha subunit Lsd1 [Coemansia sp. RSA 2424]
MRSCSNAKVTNSRCMERLSLTLAMDPPAVLEMDVSASLAKELESLQQQFTTAADMALQVNWSGNESIQYRELVLTALFAEYTSDQSVPVGQAVFEAFCSKYCSTQDIHVCVDDFGLDGGGGSGEHAHTVLRAFYKAQNVYRLNGGGQSHRRPQPALFSTHSHRLLAMFGGQGGMDNYIEETRSVYNMYHSLVANFVHRMCEFLKQEAAEPLFARLYHSGLDVRTWLEQPECVPAQEYMISVPVSIPVVGLTQLMQVVVLYKTLGMSPAELASSFEGTFLCTPDKQ